ncbi:MBL fold metallo-hydrolase [Tropicibacter sp. Alg240-R139]|uniref:MBL fold metallo-hydrolase n=1 Tax=Tropicibacter sp. Alg240-R139 TaxID=2305991 RepID=UPI0013DF718E|nr:MBL fold metallo-hydrolase [Tropicibacter sp. Alg240-R139]
MRKLISNIALVAGLSLAPLSVALAADPISVDVFKGEVATVNSYIFSNGESLVVMDVQRATSEAKKLAEVIKAKDLPLTHILVSHGHPDHYIGMDWLLKEFPDAKVVVGSKGIKKDIIGFSTYMESIGWLDQEPTLKPKSETNPEGFDYEANVHVLDGDKLELEGGGTLTLQVHSEPTESENLTTIYVEDINGLFTADFGYNKVHLWMGAGVTDAHIDNWRAQLVEFQDEYEDESPTVYPGHGDPTDMALFAELIQYIDDFKRVTANATSREEAMAEMEKLYPEYGEAGFLLKNSVDFHVAE